MQSIEPLEAAVPPLRHGEQLVRRTDSEPRSTRPALAVATRTKHKGLIQGFLESAERFASRDALVVDNTNLSYCELRGRAAAIAKTILDHAGDLSPLVAVLASRSATAYTSVLGILGAGRGYVPLNPKFPVDRTRKMLMLSGCGVLVVGREALGQLPRLLPEINRSLTLILPDCSDAAELRGAIPQHRFVSSGQMSKGEGFAFDIEVNSSDIAYLLFTSGSTGEPKGVPIHHSNVRPYIEYISNRYEVNEQDHFSQQFDLTFDLSVHDMFVCWERGACLFCVPEKSVMLPAKFIRDRELTMWFSVPSVVALLSKMRLLQPRCFPRLRFSLFCGEPLASTHAQHWQEAAPNSVVENLYGPTETTIAISHYRWDPSKSPQECLNGIVPIGRVFDGQQSRVVNQERSEVSETGELCLTGPQVTDGYWNNPEKTRRQFVCFPEIGETPWYRTGDLVKRGENGCLHYLGRIDQQVKIRGYRVELQEIELVLRKASGAQQVVAVAWPAVDGSAEGVVAFLSGGSNLDDLHILNRCREALPDYMVPRNIYRLEEMPLNNNGKNDRKQLLKLLEGT
jgi:amino acid adenylation domain-containing protein